MILHFGHLTSASLLGASTGDEQGERFLYKMEQRLSRGGILLCGEVNAGFSVRKMKLPIKKEINRKEIEHGILSSSLSYCV